MGADAIDGRHGLPARRVETFVPAMMPASTTQIALPGPVAVQYRLATIGQPGARALRGNPADAEGLPLARLVASVVATFTLVLVAGLAVTATAPRLFGYGSVVVTSGSMEPSIHKADAVVTAPSDGTGLDEGTVINFDRDGGRVLHRIALVTPNGYRTAGDANPSPDSELVRPAQVRGVGIVVVPFVGLPAVWAAEGRWLPLAAALAGLMACLYMSRGSWLDGRRDALSP